MEWIEANPLPAVCRDCRQEECYACDHAGMRWQLSKEDHLRLRRKGLIRAMERLQRQIHEIDKQLEKSK